MPVSSGLPVHSTILKQTMNPDTTCRRAPRRTRQPIFFRYLSPLLLALVASWLGCDTTASPSTDLGAGEKVSGTVELLINFRDSDDLMVAVPVAADATVLSIMERAKGNGELEFEFRGQGDSAFLKSINGVENEGAGGDNWVYRVNEQLGDRSFGVFSVEADDQIVWTFGKYQPKEN